MKVTYWDYDDDTYALSMCIVDDVLYLRVNAQGLRYVLWALYYLAYCHPTLHEDSDLWGQIDEELPCEGSRIPYLEFFVSTASDEQRGQIVRIHDETANMAYIPVTSQDARKAFRLARQLEKAPDDGKIHRVEIMKNIILELYPSQ